MSIGRIIWRSLLTLAAIGEAPTGAGCVLTASLLAFIAFTFRPQCDDDERPEMDEGWRIAITGHSAAVARAFLASRIAMRGYKM